MRRFLVGLTAALVGFACSLASAEKSARTPREALQPFNDLIGSWKATGTPDGTAKEKQRGFWTENQSWLWQFKGDDAWIKIVFTKGKHFTQGELHYLPEQAGYQLTLQNLDKETLKFTGSLSDKILTLERQDKDKKETQRLVVKLLHSNRFLMHYEVKPDDRPLYTKLYQVGATKEGVPFAAGSSQPECVVTGGVGSIRVEYKGKAYFVCCTGCRDVFQDDPEKCLKEFAARKAKEAKEKNQE